MHASVKIRAGQKQPTNMKQTSTIGTGVDINGVPTIVETIVPYIP